MKWVSWQKKAHKYEMIRRWMACCVYIHQVFNLESLDQFRKFLKSGGSDDMGYSFSRPC